MDKLKSLRFYKFFTKKIKTSKIFWEIRALYSSLEIMISFVNYGIKQSKRVYKRRKAEAFNSNKEVFNVSSKVTKLLSNAFTPAPLVWFPFVILYAFLNPKV